MTIEKFKEIIKWLREVTTNSSFDKHIYIVGGAVRDFVMNQEIKDIDLVLDIKDGGIKFAEWMYQNGYTHGSVVTYPTYGTAMFKPSEYPEVELECVHTRGEQYHDKNSRNPETCFASIEEDAFRRDLTINALYMNLGGEVLDITGKGLSNIKNHIIRVTNDNPDIVYQDDPLRMMRTIRFSSRYGWDIDEKTLESVKRNVERLQIISKERIQDEFRKILLSKNARMGMELLKETGLLIQFIPEFKEAFVMKQNVYHNYCTVWEHTLRVIEHASEESAIPEEKEILMLGAVFHDIGKVRTYSVKDGKVHFYNHEFESEKMVEEIMRRLKYPVHTINEVKFIVKHHMRFKGVGENTPKDKSIRKFQYECQTKARFKLAVRLMHCDNLSHGEKYCLPTQAIRILSRSAQLVDCGEDMFEYKLPITGDDIMQFKGIHPGPEIKKYQEYLLKMAFNNVKEITRENCFKYIKNINANKI